MKKRGIILISSLVLIGGILGIVRLIQQTTPLTPKPSTTRHVQKKKEAKKVIKKNKPTAKKNTKQEEIAQIQWQKQSQPIAVPILMYHSIRRVDNNSLCVPPEIFEQQMKWLKDNGYYTLTAPEVYRILTTNEVPSQKFVWITLDDGYVDNYTQAYPIFQKYQLKATINLITQAINTNGMLSLNQIKEMQASGLVEYGSHTITHRELNTLTATQQLQEMTGSKQWLEANLGQKIIYLCYPVGRFNNQSLLAAKQAGYLLATTTQPGVAWSQNPSNLYQLKRLRITPNLSLQQYSQLLQQGR